MVAPRQCPTWTSDPSASGAAEPDPGAAAPLSRPAPVRNNRVMANAPPLHADLQPFLFLLGSWKGKGSGTYPGIEDFSYLEVATFTHVGKPFLAYSQRTRDAATGLPLHAETGYLRPAGHGRAEFIVVQPTGIVEVHHVDVGSSSLAMRSTEVVTTATAKQVDAVVRELEVSGESMHYTLDMAATGHPMQRHLEASLDRS